MYENFFQLSQRPFAAAPQVDAYVSTPLCENALQSSIRCLERAEGIALIMGPTGTGKSLLCQMVAKHFADRFQVALLNSARLCTRRALLQNILFALRLPYRNMDEGELRLALMAHLEPQAGGSHGLILIVDEAHTLPQRLLEEVRLITNLVHDGQPRIRLLLAGGMAMEERLASPKLEAFQQRLATRSYLQSFTYDETLHYIGQQIYRCGGDANRCFPVEAMDAVYRVTDGVPRLVNQLCDHALLLAANQRNPRVDRHGIEDAWADLQQLPGPWHADHPQAAKPVDAGVIEFGQLADDASFSVEFDALEDDVPVAKHASVPALESPGVTFAAFSPRSESQPADLREEWPFVAPINPPIAVSQPVVVAVPQMVNPFGDDFEEEELVLDRYAGMASAVFEKSPRVSSQEGKEIGRQLDALVIQASEKKLQVRNDVAAESYAKADALDSGFDSESLLSVYSQDDEVSQETEVADEPAYAEFEAGGPFDPVVPVSSMSSEGASGVRTYRPFAFGDGIDDDRDMIVVSEQEHHRTESTTVAPHGRRREYRQLFSSLRRGN